MKKQIVFGFLAMALSASAMASEVVIFKREISDDCVTSRSTQAELKLDRANGRAWIQVTMTSDTRFACAGADVSVEQFTYANERLTYVNGAAQFAAKDGAVANILSSKNLKSEVKLENIDRGYGPIRKARVLTLSIISE